MSDMIEKAARAVAEHHPSKDWGWGSMHQEEIDYCFAVARAVLLAVREPDVDLRMKGRNAIMNSGASPYADFSVSVGHGFTAMIDAILKEDPK